MKQRNLVLALVAVLAFAFGATQAGGKKHAHKVLMTYVSKPVFTGPGQVGGGFVLCPGSSKVTGGGEDWVDGLATIDMGFSGNGYYVLVDNFDSPLPSQVDVQAACTTGTSKVKARPMSRAQVKSALNERIARLEAAHRTAER
jgi:hypothetical protein